MLLFSDLHMRPESEEVAFQVLDAVFRLSQQLGDPNITFLGDWFHVRYAVPVHLLNRVHALFWEWSRAGVRLRLLPGNHDQVDVGGQHALEVFRDIPRVQVFSHPTHEAGVGTWLPYRRDPRDLVNWIAGNKPPTHLPAFLHHGIVGAYMNDAIQAGPKDGLAPSELPFPTVFCGHWHRHQVVQQCVYVGSQWQTKVDESGQVKGVIHTAPDQLHKPGLNGEPRSWTFIPLEVGRRHHKIQQFTAAELEGIRPGDLVRVEPGQLSPKEMGKLVSALQEMGADVQVGAQEKVYAPARLGGQPGAPLREQAEKYVAAQVLPDGLDAVALMRVFDEVANG